MLSAFFAIRIHMLVFTSVRVGYAKYLIAGHASDMYLFLFFVLEQEYVR